MKVKEKTNLQNKKELKNLLDKNTQPSLQRVNIHTIFDGKQPSNKHRFLCSILDNNNLLKEDEIFSFSFYESNKEPSSINSLNSSPNSTYTQKKKNYKRFLKSSKKKYKDFMINSSNSKDSNKNQSVSLCSSSSSNSINNISSDSSNYSYRSRANRRKKFKKVMKAEEEENLDFLKRREVGLFSSDDEENSIDNDNENSFENNLNNEIERILIEIYNTNITIISSGNYSELNNNKNKKEIKDVEKQITNYLKEKNFKTNLLVLKCLSNKIKELVGKYKEKILEIEEIKNIYETNKLKILLLRNSPLFHSNNSLGSNAATNSNSPYDSGNYKENLIKNKKFLNVQDEIRGKGISRILLRELSNIKKTLKKSSKEIETIFKYPLNLLKNENGKKIKFSVKLMQLEEFCKTLLNEVFISNY